MYFDQEFIPLNYAILVSSTIVLAVIDLRSLTMMRPRIALLGNDGLSEMQPLRGLGEATAFHTVTKQRTRSRSTSGTRIRIKNTDRPD